MKPSPPGPTAAAPPRRLRAVSRELPADLETPVSAFLKLKPHGAMLLLESVERGVQLGRYSFIGIAPRTKIIIDESNLMVIGPDGRTTVPHEREDAAANPLTHLKTLLGSYEIDFEGDHPPLLGGTVGYISYDMVRQFERLPDRSRDVLGLPLAMLYLIDTLLVFDHVQHRLRLIALTDDADTTRTEKQLQTLTTALRTPLEYNGTGSVNDQSGELTSNVRKEDFCTTVEQVKEHIAAGDVYQLVVSQRLTGRTEADPFTIYRALRMLNPSPYLFYLDFDETKLIGSSPEALVSLAGRQATVRPIAGTRPRGDSLEDDRRLAEELLADDKERAEHVMLVDLGRNDLGRCCATGSVKVSEFMAIERFSHVMHMTSTVHGRLRDDVDQFELFRAAFPAGTVSGAPKIRAMQLIEQFEPHRRGPYAGAVGYFSLSGDMDWCIAIRTIVMKGATFHLQAGAGIVADSVPEREYEETLHKLAALRRAIAAAEEGF
ncbi:anthranilate synthase component I [candidate division GN15 bacterium]|nr:anthranilate synthase component I [candidate division GN15 bacterium]